MLDWGLVLFDGLKEVSSGWEGFARRGSLGLGEQAGWVGQGKHNGADGLREVEGGLGRVGGAWTAT